MMLKLVLVTLSAIACLAHPGASASDPGADTGTTPAISHIVLGQQHAAKPATGLVFTGVYSTNFNETPYCCPFSPKMFEVPNQPKGWGGTPMICQVADSGQDGVFGKTGTVMLGDAYVRSNGSVSYIGSAASRNGIYTFEFASRDTKTFNKYTGFFNFIQSLNSPLDGGYITGPWLWKFLREPTVAECEYALRLTMPSRTVFKS